MTQYKNPTCRGCYALGTACGHCERCKDELLKMAKAPSADEVPGHLSPFRVHQAVGIARMALSGGELPADPADVAACLELTSEALFWFLVPKPIESAPQDGTPVFLYGGRYATHGGREFMTQCQPKAVVAVFEEFTASWRVCNQDFQNGIVILDPTHWLPTPAVGNPTLENKFGLE